MKAAYSKSGPITGKMVCGGGEVLGRIPLEKIVLTGDIESRTVQVHLFEHSGQYFLGVEVNGLGHGHYNKKQIFKKMEDAYAVRKKLAEELKKGKSGKYRIEYDPAGGLDAINLTLTK